MDLEQVKAKINALLEQLETVIEFAKTLGLPEEKLEVLEDTEHFLQKLIGNIEALETEESLAALETELRDTNLTLQGLRETLMLWEPPDEETIADVDKSQAEIRKLLLKVKSGRSLKKKAPIVLMGVVLAFAAFKSKR